MFDCLLVILALIKNSVMEDKHYYATNCIYYLWIILSNRAHLNSFPHRFHSMFPLYFLTGPFESSSEKISNSNWPFPDVHVWVIYFKGNWIRHLEQTYCDDWAIISRFIADKSSVQPIQWWRCWANKLINVGSELFFTKIPLRNYSWDAEIKKQLDYFINCKLQLSDF